MSTVLPKHLMSEEDIKLQYITPAITAKWDIHKITTEQQITDGRINLKGNLVHRERPKRADYLLYMSDNNPIAVVEAKDSNHTVRYGLQQAMVYAQMLDLPFAYSSNGDGFVEHDFLTGKEREFPLSEFPTEAELIVRYCSGKNGGMTPQQRTAMNQPYQKAWSRLEDFNKRFPGDMQKSILQMAIQGKLVEQRPEEGTGEELYQQIQAEKQKLIKEGKIKKEKPLPEISEDEIPFDIPESWMWVRMGDLAQLITKGSSPKWQGIRYVERGLLFVTSENVGVNALLLDNKKYVEERFTQLSPRSQLMKGDLLTNIVGASIGRTAVYNLDEPANINQAVCIIRLIDRELIRYILMYLNSTAAYNIMMSDKVDTARANISLTNICNFIVPLPPLAEQKRIVAKLEKILPLYERLK